MILAQALLNRCSSTHAEGAIASSGATGRGRQSNRSQRSSLPSFSRSHAASAPSGSRTPASSGPSRTPSGSSCVTIQKEVVAGAVLQQTFVIEYVIGNKQCPLCQRREAKDTWMALVQVRQRVPHKRTFLWLEQLILKHSAHADTVNIAEVKDGLDFFFDQRAHAEKLVSFLQSVAPTRYKTSKQLISQDVHTGKGKIKLTYSVEVLPICKDDVVWMPRPIAVGLGQMHQLCLCSKVSNVVHFVDPTTLQAGEMQPMAYWKTPFNASLSRGALVEFVILDLEYREADWRAPRP